MTTVKPIYLAGQTYIVKELPGGRLPHISLAEVGAIFDRGGKKQIVALNENGDKFWKLYEETVSGWIPGQIWKAPDIPLSQRSVDWQNSVNWSPDNVLITPGTLFNSHTIKNFVSNQGTDLTISLSGNTSPFLIAGRKPQIEADGYRLEWAQNSDYTYSFDFTDNLYIDQIRLRFSSQNAPTGTRIILKVFKSASSDMFPNWVGDVTVEDYEVKLTPTSTNQVYSLQINQAAQRFSIQLEPVNTGEATIVIADWLVRPQKIGHFYRIGWDVAENKFIGTSLFDGAIVDLVDQNRANGWSLQSQVGRSVQRMTSAPTENDDERFGFDLGSSWSTLTSNIYECLNPKRFNAVWSVINARSLVRGDDPSLRDASLDTTAGGVPGFYGKLSELDFISSNREGLKLNVPSKTLQDRSYAVELDGDGLAQLKIDTLLLEKYEQEGDNIISSVYTLPFVDSNAGDALTIETKTDRTGRIDYRLGFKNIANLTVDRSLDSSTVTPEISGLPSIANLETNELSQELFFINYTADLWQVSRVQNLGGFYIFATEVFSNPRFVWDNEANAAYLFRPAPVSQRYQIYPSSGGSGITVSESAPTIESSEPDWKLWRQETDTEIKQFAWAKVGGQYIPLPLPWFQRIEDSKLVDVYSLTKPTQRIETSSTVPVSDPADPTGTILRNVFLIGTFSISMAATTVGWHYQLRVADTWQEEIKVTTSTFTSDATANVDGLRMWFPRQDPATDNPAYENTNLGS